MLPPQSDELLPQSWVLQEQIAAGTRESGNKNGQKSQQADRTTRFTPVYGANAALNAYT
jgi:hypothetical protein